VRARGLIIVDVAPKIEAQGATRIRDFMRATEAGLGRNVRLHEDGRWYWHWDPAFMRISDDEAGHVVEPASRLATWPGKGPGRSPASRAL
jgi:hypothetical protein